MNFITNSTRYDQNYVHTIYMLTRPVWNKVILSHMLLCLFLFIRYIFSVHVVLVLFLIFFNYVLFSTKHMVGVSNDRCLSKANSNLRINIIIGCMFFDRELLLKVLIFKHPAFSLSPSWLPNIWLSIVPVNSSAFPPK